LSTEQPIRIASLLPAATEIVCALGFQDNLVGLSHECDYPNDLASLPVCTKALISPDGTSLEIDTAVKNALKNALSIYHVEDNALGIVKPDVIITQDQCEVCAVALKDVEAAVCDLLESDAQIVSLNPEGIENVYKDIERVADALNVHAKGAELTQAMQQRLEAICHATEKRETPSVACIEWADPLMAAGNWVPSLVDIAGGHDLFGQAGLHAPWLDPEKLIAANPDIIVFMPCGFGLERSTQEAQTLMQTQEWQAIKAVKTDNVYATDGNSFFNRPGPRIVENAEILTEIFFPDMGAPQHHGTGWVKVAQL
jgi:iron complex transport system substrate-binding protein